jgi:hypothetical protein
VSSTSPSVTWRGGGAGTASSSVSPGRSTTKTWLRRSVLNPRASWRYFSVVISRGGSAAAATSSSVPYRPASGSRAV